MLCRRVAQDMERRHAEPDFYTETPSGCLYPRYILYLNVKEQPGVLLNGVLFVISVEELKAMDQHEWIYNRKVITAQLHGASVIGGDAYMYVAKPEHTMTDGTSPATAAIRASYLQILELGIGQLGPPFREAYNRSSDAIPQHLVIKDIRDEQAPNPFGRKQ